MYVPSLDTYIKSTNLTRFDILTQMLEHKNPAFVLNCILRRVSKDILLEYINYGEMINEAYDKNKLAYGTGSGSLKRLIGASKNTKLEPAQWEAIGYKIARMSDFNRRDYVGMMNFLHVSCDLYSEIHKNLVGMVKKKKKINEEKENDLGFTPNFINSINSVDDITKLVAYALTRLSDIDCSDIENEINNGDIDVDDIDNIADNEQFEKYTVESNENDNFYNYVNPNTEKEEIIEETKGYRGRTYIGQGGVRMRGKGKNELLQMRNARGNGQGGLKEFVGVPPENDLTYGDLRKIAAKIIQNANPEECSRALSNVNFLGSACDSFNNLKRGYLSGIMKRKKGKKGYGKKAAANNNINKNTMGFGTTKSKHRYK